MNKNNSPPIPYQSRSLPVSLLSFFPLNQIILQVWLAIVEPSTQLCIKKKEGLFQVYRSREMYFNTDA